MCSGELSVLQKHERRDYNLPSSPRLQPDDRPSLELWVAPQLGLDWV